jgi:nucleoid-associated protein YgaU
MQRDVKIGIAIGVLLVALIAIFWWMKSTNEATLPPQRPAVSSDMELPGPVEPVAPVGGTALPSVTEPSGPEVSISGPAVDGSSSAPAGPTRPVTSTGTVSVPDATGAPLVPVPVEPVRPPAPAQKTHTVAAGDTLSGLSEKYYGSERYWQKIYEANNSKLASPDALKVGMTLTIPEIEGTTAPISSGASAAKERTHTVAAKETLSGISKKYYGSEGKWRLIYNANREKIPSPDHLQVGTVLVIPPAE